MTLKLIYFIIAVVLFVVVEVLKRFAPKFYNKIKNFIPMIIAVLAVALMFLFSFFLKESMGIESAAGWFVKCFTYGLLIAGSEVLSYEAILKHILSFITKISTGKKVEDAAQETLDEAKEDLKKKKTNKK